MIPARRGRAAAKPGRGNSRQTATCLPIVLYQDSEAKCQWYFSDLRSAGDARAGGANVPTFFLGM